MGIVWRCSVLLFLYLGIGLDSFEIAFFLPLFGLLSGFRHYTLDATMRVYELAHIYYINKDVYEIILGTAKATWLPNVT